MAQSFVLSLHSSTTLIFLAFLAAFARVGCEALTISPYAALGDSYATGAGCGAPLLWPLQDARCGRFSDSYPRMISSQTKGTPFRNLACGGSTTGSVLLAQVPWIEDSQILTLTVGGNEVDFFKLVNDCIYQWIPLSSCDAAIEKSRSLIESTNFMANFDKMIDGIMRGLRPGGRLLVTGYAKFFNDRTKQCSHISFSKTDAMNLLTQELRTELNDLMRLLNDVIKSTAIAHGAEYVDINVIFEGHRFCEEGVVEPDPGRQETWFLTLGSSNEGLEIGGQMHHQQSNTQFDLSKLKDGVPEFSVFHPTTQGQTAIADEIIRYLLL